MQIYRFAMKFKVVLSLLVVVLIMITSLDVNAQARKSYHRRKSKSKAISNYRGGSIGGRFRPYNFVTFNVNALNYFGDLAPVNKAASTDVSFTRPGFGGEFGRKFNPRIAFRVGFNYGRIKGDDISSDPNNEESRSRYLRNLSFRNDIKELHGGVELYLLPNYGGPNVRQKLNAYLFVGAAVYHHNPKAKVPEYDYTTGGTEKAPHAGEWVSLHKLGTEGQYIKGVGVDKPYHLIQASIPLALGVTMRLQGRFELGLEFGYRILFTDYIDDVSNKYVGDDQFTNKLARIMADRSAEPTDAWTGQTRDPSIRIASATMSDGNTYYSAGDIGGGLVQGARRGDPGHNDQLFMTSIKLRMILNKSNSKVAKFR